MKLSEAIRRLDKSEKYEEEVYINEIAESQFDIDLRYYGSQSRLKSYWLGNWYCTDQYVGYKIYFLDDIPVAFSQKDGRKCQEDFHWIGLNKAKKVKEYLLSLEEDGFDYLKVCTLDSEVDDSYKVSHNSQLLNSDRLLYKGEKVILVRKIKNPSESGVDKKVLIETAAGEKIELEVGELDIEYNLI